MSGVTAASFRRPVDTFIILVALHLDFGLCAFTGLVTAVEHVGVGVYFLGPPQIDPSVSEPL
jgi:hypothetical protein